MVNLLSDTYFEFTTVVATLTDPERNINEHNFRRESWAHPLSNS